MGDGEVEVALVVEDGDRRSELAFGSAACQRVRSFSVRSVCVRNMRAHLQHYHH